MADDSSTFNRTWSSLYAHCNILAYAKWHMDCKEIQPVHPKGDQSWVFTGRTDVEAETLILWPPHAKSWLIGKDPDAGKDWGQEEKGMTEDKMVGWRHQLNGHGFGWTPGVGDGQAGLACCSLRGRKESDTTELNWHDKCHDSSKVDQKRPKNGQWPNFWKSLPLSQNSWNNPPSY